MEAKRRREKELKERQAAEKAAALADHESSLRQIKANTGAATQHALDADVEAKRRREKELKERQKAEKAAALAKHKSSLKQIRTNTSARTVHQV